MEAPGERPQPTGATDIWRRRFNRGRSRWFGIAVAVLFSTALLLEDPGPLPDMRLWAFDQYQIRFPRHQRIDAARIVEIDDDSLRRIGQWPWPRDLLARMIDRIAEQKPLAIGLDILFTEEDRASPERVAKSLRLREPALAEQLARLQPNDAILAESLARNRVVIGVAGVDASLASGTPKARALLVGGEPPLYRFGGALRSLPALDHAAKGHALLNAGADRGIVRSMPLAASVAGDPMLTMALETLRVGNQFASFRVNWTAQGIASVEVGEYDVRTNPQGRVWLHFTPPYRPPYFVTEPGQGRYISAADVIEGKPEALARLNGVIVLVGATALALLDQNTTARGERMPGIEFHAQLIENIVEGALLTRPVWMRFLEAGLFAIVASAFIVLVPRMRPRRSVGMLLAFALVLVASGVVAFLFGRTLFDPATPLVGTALLFGLMLSASLVVADLERRELATRLAREREAAARVAGELEAARRIQSGILPTRESVIRNERRIEIFAFMKAAREVGGDLYDFFPLSEDKFAVLLGDVSGKGLPAAMFMAVSKALAKSTALRTGASPAELMTMFNAEISRENPEQMFVTLLVLVMDLKTGEMQYCNAGHEPLILVHRSGETFSLDEGGGPPLCVIDDYQYEEASALLQPRDLLAIVSDGITEAMNPARALYGRARLLAMLELAARRDVDVTILGNEVLAAVKTFEAGAEPADDQTLLLVTWRGPQ